MTTDLPLVNRYLTALDAALGDMAPVERREVVAEIRQHIADAAAAGKPIDEVLGALGSVDALARAYKLELLISPRPNAPAQPRSDRWLKVVGLLAIGSLPSFIIIVTLGALGLSLSLSGMAVAIAGIADAAGALPFWVTSNVQPWFTILVGVILTVVGLLASWATVAYVRFVVRLVRRAAPRQTPAS